MQIVLQKCPFILTEGITNLGLDCILNYARPYGNKMFLIVVNSFSKWTDIIATDNATSEEAT